MDGMYVSLFKFTTETKHGRYTIYPTDDKTIHFLLSVVVL